MAALRTSTSSFISAMDLDCNTRTHTENGALCVSNKGVGNATLALFFKLVRALDDDTLKELFDAAVAEASTDPVDLFVLAFHTRATRGKGKGEKALFYKLLLLLANQYGTEAVVAILELVPVYGYWKDLLAILEMPALPTPITDKCLSLYVDQLKEDVKELEAATTEKRTPKLSLSGKYAPREGSHFDKRPLQLAKKLAADMYGGANPSASARKYRKALSSLNTALNTTEVLMAAGRWEEIKFASVASLCLTRCRKAFLNEKLEGKLSPAQAATGNRCPDNPARVAARQHLREALCSKTGVKGKQLMPHEITQKFMRGGAARLSTLEADLLAAQWNSMRSGVVESIAAAAEQREQAVHEASGTHGLETLAALGKALPKHVDLGKLVPLVDVSGSMHGTPMEVAIALGILVSELTHDAFKHRCLTFESSPNWVDLSACTSIGDKVRKVEKAGWGGSTNFEAAFERILATAQAAKLSPDEIPDLIVFSDMQFDQARGHDMYMYVGGMYASPSWETEFERLQRRFAEVGRDVCGEPWPAPRIIFWNLRSSVGFPVAKDTPNTQMLSGFSPALFKMVVSGADLVADEEEVVQPDGTIKTVRAGPTPEQTLRATLDDSNFDAVRLKLSSVSTGPLADYVFEKEDVGFALVD